MGILERPEQLVLRKRDPAVPSYEAIADAVTKEILAL